MDNEKMETETPTKVNGCEAMDIGSPKSGSANIGLKERGKYDWTENIKPHIKIAVIGESGCGKSALILAATDQIFPHPDEKYVSKRHYWEFKVDGNNEECMIAEIDDWDTNEGRREKMYTEKDIVVLVCFDDYREMQAFKKKWMSKFQDHDVPVIFVKICKLMPTTNEGRSDKRPIVNAPDDCMTCCPYRKSGVREVFEEAIRKIKKA